MSNPYEGYKVQSLINTYRSNPDMFNDDQLDELERLAQGLLEYETLDGDEVKIIVEGGKLVRKDAVDTPNNQKPKRKSRTVLPGTGRPKKPGSEPA